jgi:hypothetical protein
VEHSSLFPNETSLPLLVDKNQKGISKGESMRSNKRGSVDVQPPKDIYQLFLDREVRRAWGEDASPKQQAKIILDYYQAMLQAIGIDHPCEHCIKDINIEQIRANAKILLQELQERKKQMHQQPSPTRADWRALFRACLDQLDGLTHLCKACKPIFQREIIAQFYQVRKQES